MNRQLIVRLTMLTLLLSLVSAGSVTSAADRTLNSVLYSDREKASVSFESTDRAPSASLASTVRIEGSQAMIELSYKKLEPALLFGGDVNAWVVWIVAPDGQIQNLGELPVRGDQSGSASFSSPQLNFAMMVTAEPIQAVRRPSDIVAFISSPVTTKYAKNTPITFGDFRMGTKRDTESIAKLHYEDKTPVELQQARRAVDLLIRSGADKSAAKATQDAQTALTQANDAYAGRVGKKGDVSDLARRVMISASEAVRQTIKALEAEKAGAEEAKRQAQLGALGQQAAQAEQGRQLAEKQRNETAAALAQVVQQRQALEADTVRLNAEKNRIQMERDQLAQRLSGALGKVAKTEQTGRGLVLSLSGGVLFDSGKSVLKSNATIALAKLAGILLMTPDRKIQVEGHTDNVGTEATNQKLSLDRAQSVVAFLQEQGVDATRMTAQGFGPTVPVAPNDTSENKAKNRRVEVIFAGEGGAGAP